MLFFFSRTLYYLAVRVLYERWALTRENAGKQRLRKPQVTGSNPVVGCHAVASAEADRLISSNFLLRATAWQALDSELLESDD